MTILPDYVPPLQIKRLMDRYIPIGWAHNTTTSYDSDKKHFILDAAIPNLADPSGGTIARMQLHFERQMMEKSFHAGIIPVVMRDTFKYITQSILTVMFESSIAADPDIAEDIEAGIRLAEERIAHRERQQTTEGEPT